MKILKLVLAIIVMASLSLNAAELWRADFESPTYSLGELTGQDLWDGDLGQTVATSYGPVTAAEGSQFIYVDQLAITYYTNIYDAIANIDVTNNYLTFSYYMLNTGENNNNVGFYDVDGGSMFFVNTDIAGPISMPWNGGAILGTQTQGEWQHISVDIDCIGETLAAINGSVNGVEAPSFRAEFTQPGLPTKVRVRPYGGSNLVSYSCFDDFKITTKSAYRVDITPRGLIYVESGSQTVELVAQIPSSSYLSTFSTSNSWITLDKTEATVTTNPTSLEVTVDITGLTIPALGSVMITGPNGEETEIAVSVRTIMNEYEGFDYAVGEAIVDQTGGENWNKAWTQTSGDAVDAVATEALTYMDAGGVTLTTDGNNASLQPQGNVDAVLNRPFTARNGEVYFSFLVKPVTLHNGYDYRFSLKGAGNSVSLTARGWGTQNWLVGGFDEQNRPSQLPIPSVGTTQFMVGKIDTAAGTCAFWSNPNLSNPGEPSYTQTGYAFVSFDTVELYQQGNATIAGSVTNSFDEIRIGSTFDEVAPCNVPTDVFASDGTYFDKVEITWKGVKDASQYSVYRAVTNDSSVSTLLGTATETVYEDTTGEELIVYYYWVTSNIEPDVYGFGDDGYRARSDYPATPENLMATQGTLTNAIALTWDASARSTKYMVFRATYNDIAYAVDISGEITTNMYLDSDIIKGSSYYYWVKGGNEHGWSFPSESAIGFTEYTASICYENFDYPAGVALQGLLGGLGFDGPWSASATFKINADGLTYPGLQTSGRSVQGIAISSGIDGKRFTTAEFGVSNQVWYSLLLRRDVSQVGHCFLTANGNNRAGKAWGDVYSIHNTGSDVPVVVGETALLVVKNASDGASLWINPNLEAEPSVGTAAVSSPDTLAMDNVIGMNIDWYYGSNTFTFDEIRFGNTWDEVTPNYLVKNVQATDGSFTDKVVVSWNLRDDAVSYVVYRNTTEDSSTAMAISAELTTDTFDDTTAVAGDIYYYWIFATFTDTQQAFSYSATGYMSVSGAPAPPANLVASDSVPDQKFVSITYDASAGATFYRIYRSSTEDYASAEDVSGDIAGTSYADSSVIAGVKYYYWVRAKNASGWSNFGDSDSGAIPAILVAYYAMNELDSTNMVDSSDNGFDGIYRDDPDLGVPSADAILFETAVDFYANDATINSNTPIRDLTNNFTVAMWVKPEEFGTDEYRYLMGLDSEVGGWSVQTYNDEVLLDITGKGNAWTGAALSLTEWTHVAFTFDYNNQVRAFVDGIALDAQTKIGAPADYVLAETYIANGGAEELYLGSLDEIRVYDGVVTDAAIAELAGVPEPATLSMLLLSLIGLLVCSRK